MTPLSLAAVAVLAPLFIAGVLLVVHPLRRAGKPAAALSLLGAGASFGASVALFIGYHEPLLAQWSWLPNGAGTLATVGVHVDGVTASMLLVVSLVALCVQVFSLEYMSDEDDPGYGRYFTWHSLFLFSMQGLVVAPNLLQLFACWELVGLCSYLLIGFYYRKPSAARASLKAFWMTKLADMGLLLGIIVQYVYAGSFNWDPETVSTLAATGAAPWVAGMLFVAVMGKSAQFPLHVWLPDAMEGPTPVSALLHAATMVAAGVYLIVRAYPIFEVAPQVMTAMAVVGGVTAGFAACVAVVQTDIKKVLAYSTCSQLGYMVAALGAGTMMGGYFHLTTHAFFKALLFLAAGSVIHAVHSNEIADMGGLLKKMPITGATFIIGSAALAGLPLLSGFYSKDLILETLVHRAAHDPIFWVPAVSCLATVGLTAFYMSRVVFLAFFGQLNAKSEHAHEGGVALKLPLIALAILAVGAGWGGDHLAHLYGVHDVHFPLLHVTPVGAAASGLAIGGIGLGAWMYLLGGGSDLRDALAPVGAIARSGAVNAAWARGYREVAIPLSAVIGWFDRYVIDGLINLVGGWTLIAGDKIRATQTGRVTDYVSVVVVGVLLIMVWSQLLVGVGT